MIDSMDNTTLPLHVCVPSHIAVQCWPVFTNIIPCVIQVWKDEKSNVVVQGSANHLGCHSGQDLPKGKNEREKSDWNTWPLNSTHCIYYCVSVLQLVIILNKCETTSMFGQLPLATTEIVSCGQHDATSMAKGIHDSLVNPFTTPTEYAIPTPTHTLESPQQALQ